jgi:hypothetical protein
MIGKERSSTAQIENDQDDWVVLNERPVATQLNDYLLTMATGAE